MLARVPNYCNILYIFNRSIQFRAMETMQELLKKSHFANIADFLVFNALGFYRHSFQALKLLNVHCIAHTNANFGSDIIRHFDPLCLIHIHIFASSSNAFVV